jgi:hypothetical protein
LASICALLKPYERERNSCLSAAEAQKFMVGDDPNIRPASVLDKTDEQRGAAKPAVGTKD